ncbi:MFS transporter [Actinokineospora guangxiensis]|uniref:MFS transporter n=1 Tax=Actinokineospora guangxiensis TaxID=1490288 RepID=A0ABW0ETU2_9PSEU
MREASPARVQRRTLVVLVVSQVLSGAGLAAGVTVGVLLAQDVLGSTGLSGVAIALTTAGSAVSAVVVGRLSQARGRRAGLAIGYLTGALGGAGIVVAGAVGSAGLLFASLVVYGAGTATNLQARYAGADLAEPERRGRAVSTVLVSTTVGGVLGPNLAAPTGAVAERLGLPALTGPFLLAVVAYVTAAVVLTAFLRPDPLLMAASLRREDERRGVAERDDRRGVVTGGTVMVLTQLVMVAIMTMTPIHMSDHGHSTAAAGLVIAVHIAAMFLPSPVTGILTDRFGPHRVSMAAGVVLVAAGLLAATAPGHSVPLLSVALALLGFGWNLGLVAGTAIITTSVPLATRARTQGVLDVSVALSGATGGLLSGVVVAGIGFPSLGLIGALLALSLLPVIWTIRRRRPQG